MGLPKALRDIATKFERSPHTIQPDTLQFSIFGSVAPTIEIPAVDTRYAGQTVSHSSHSRTPYEPNTVNFTVDNRFNNYWVIYTWLNMLNNDVEGVYDFTERTKSGPNMDYRSDISIFALDEYNKRVGEFLYVGCFPVSLGGISYNYRDSGEIESSFTYKYSQLIFRPLIDTEVL
jgi:hypothetical protein